MEADDLVDAFWTHYRLTRGQRDDCLAAKEWFWAWEEVTRLAGERDPGVDLLLAVADAAPDAALADLGSGPIDELVISGGSEIVDAMDAAARMHARFRLALRSAWFDSEIPEASAARLRRFGPPP